MLRLAYLVFALGATSSIALAAERPMRFWNLTLYTIS